MELHLVNVDEKNYVVVSEIAEVLEVSKPTLLRHTYDYSAAHNVTDAYRVMNVAVGEEKTNRRSLLNVEYIEPILQEYGTRINPSRIARLLDLLAELNLNVASDGVAQNGLVNDQSLIDEAVPGGDAEIITKYEEEINQLRSTISDVESRATIAEETLRQVQESLALVVAEKEGLTKLSSLQTEMISKLECMLKNKGDDAVKMTGWIDALISQREILNKINDWVDQFKFPPYPGIHMLIHKSGLHYKKIIEKRVKHIRGLFRDWMEQHLYDVSSEKGGTHHE